MGLVVFPVIVSFGLPARVTVNGPVPLIFAIGWPSKTAPVTSPTGSGEAATITVVLLRPFGSEEATLAVPSGVRIPPTRGRFSPGRTGCARQ